MAHANGSKWTPEMDALLAELRGRGQTAKEIAGAMGLTVYQVEGRLKRTAPPAPAPADQPIGVIGIGQIMKQYDTREAVAREVALITPETVIEQAELARRACGNDRTRFNRCIELHAEEFKPNRVQMRLGDSRENRWYWGHPEFIAKIRSLVEKYK
jgi:hypothetical protein